ncbi:purine-cytosine permease family protein [Aureibacillus halotolerans]|uniref:Purine-cytosine permease-like protein n=1 Tax=Aureibacillus halotolerans TaxID=1508390 RepID=A0A4R6U4M7_9BACI|nr:cytosine permease [Aureibacillus halotolerans]TDQ41111.1 purine-cytosine permease-like protein [Aureibacillus halotolerans]
MEQKTGSSLFLTDAEKTAGPKDLFFIWFAANMGVLGIVYGAIIVGFGLSFFQSMLVAIIGPLSFLLVGLVSLSGRDAGATTFVLSRAAYGFRGNYIPAMIGWITQIGWLTVNVSTGTLTILALLSQFGIGAGTTTTIIGLIIFAGMVIVSSFFSQERLVKMQTFFTYVFGGLTLLVIAMLIPSTNWGQLLSMESGSWVTGFLPALVFCMIGTGMTWTKVAADYSRFQKKSNSSLSIMASVTLGAAIPLIIIIGAGVLLASYVPDLASASNPISAIIDSGALPHWVVVLYTLAALGGLTPMCFIGLKSSGLIMKSFNIEMKESTVIVIHSLIIIVIPIYVLIVSNSFMSFFQAFLGVLGIGLAAWVAVFAVDYLCLRKNGYDAKLLEDEKANPVNRKGVISWIVGVLVGAMFTKSSLYTGLFAVGIFAESNLGVFFTLVTSAMLYLILIQFGKKDDQFRRN